MEKNFTVKEFCEGYVNCGDKEEQEKYIKKNLKTCDYVSLSDKLVYVDIIAGIAVNTKEHSLNSIGQYISTLLSIIQLYTNIEVNFDDTVNEYDILQRSEVSAAIVGNLSGDIQEFNHLIDLQVEDKINTAFSGYAGIIDVFDVISESFGKAIATTMDNNIETTIVNYKSDGDD